MGISPFGLLEQKYHRLGGRNNRNFFLTVLGAGKSKMKALADLLSGEDAFPGLQMTILSLCPHWMEGVRELSEVPFIRALIPFMRALPS